MEEFTCWWHPLDSEDSVTYTFMYTTGERAPQECSDYESGGPNSCFFDSKHTQIWEVYCMNVTAHTRTGSITSQRHCLDVADIVETDPPFNLSYTVLNSSVVESCRTVLVSWMYPIASHVREGWITLVYELRYRHLAQPEHWKVKERLRESHLELLDLSVGSYELMVRCRSTNSKHWSAWSQILNITITATPLTDRMLAFLLGTGVAVLLFLIIGFGVIPRGKRIKAFLLPTIPKPRIKGLDPILLKKGKICDINHHFSNFHSYKPTQYCMETWYHVCVDAGPAAVSNSFMSYHKKDDRGYSTPSVQIPDVKQSQTSRCAEPEPPGSYCEGPAEVTTPTENTSGAWPESSHTHPELVSFPGMDYSMIVNPTPADSAAMQPAPQDFYTCVNWVTANGTVQLVPCFPDALNNMPYLQFKEGLEDGVEKCGQLAALLDKQMEAFCSAAAAGETEQNECVKPLLPHPAGRN
ncbi:growth hormone receptor-like isoform X2 [Myxocyprinus asiaticus]|nr:growth hormone receptor-like isoform X2 [Myxocyprinus asiaticus]XP_051558027.1 growth hormone receptor-like isoform X2 [Myxocyprinus asiaticus]XP_051558028.1 growth hormone receptor-like isoform X2 [Myxocyprinus asiaticus]XP_051558029.1 growth hormone receptor-like isoform X2 [Myxocyprinus asiaticus]XP_051558030.1 growth hormone receptor-like isoform X2 [Myxocyprinus asiaticus]